MKMKVADYLVDYLANIGVKEMFFVYGAANADICDAFTRTTRTKYVAVMHEQAGGFAAECYAKVSGNIGVAIATSGPGGMNFVTPIGNCFYDSIPCLFITGQINSAFLRPTPEIRQIGFQETDIVSIVKPITKYAVMIRKPEDVKYELEKALHAAKSGRPGPVLLDIPIDVQKATIETDDLVGFQPAHTVYATPEFYRQILQLVADLKTAKRPVLLVGGGVKASMAEDLVLKLGLLLKLPVFPTWNALDVVTDDYYYFGGRIGTYGGVGRNFGLQNCDLLLTVGCRVSGRITGGNVKSFCRGAKKYFVDIDPANLDKKHQQVMADECIWSDAAVFLKHLIHAISKEEMPSYGDWVNQVMTWKAKYDPVLPEYFQASKFSNPYAFMRILSDMCPDNAIVIPDCGGNLVVCNHSFKTKLGQKYFSSNGNSPMGFSFAGAIGAWFASDRKQPVIAIIGDGGFNMNIQELQVLKNYGVNMKTFILNNHIYGITKAFQETNFNGRAEACGPVGYNPPDFVRICQAYDIQTAKLETNDLSDTRDVIKHVMEFDGPIVCDVNSHEWHTYEPKIIGWKTPIEDMYPYLPEQEFLDNMIIEPLDTYKNRFYPSIQSDKNAP